MRRSLQGPRLLDRMESGVGIGSGEQTTVVMVGVKFGWRAQGLSSLPAELANHFMDASSHTSTARKFVVLARRENSRVGLVCFC